jgi:hypothetical protein
MWGAPAELSGGPPVYGDLLPFALTFGGYLDS